MIYGTINAQNLKIADTITAADTYNTLTAKFTFSKEWERLKKIAYFRKSGEESFPFILENDCIPARAGLNLGEGEWEISIRGYDLRSGSETENTAPRLTTNIAMLHVWETVSPGENEFPEVPKTFAEQILAAAEDARETAADVERRANAGEFDGRPGPQGKPGTDGVSISIKNIFESNASGGTSVVTFSDGKTLSVKNGLDGQGGGGGGNIVIYDYTSADFNAVKADVNNGKTVVIRDDGHIPAWTTEDGAISLSGNVVYLRLADYFATRAIFIGATTVGTDKYELCLTVKRDGTKIAEAVKFGAVSGSDVTADTVRGWGFAYKTEVDSLKDEIKSIEIGGTGLDSGKLFYLCKALKGVKFESEEAALFAKFFVESVLGESDTPTQPDTPTDPTPDEPETPTLTGITVTWSAESADVGTDPRTLITSVKANYSDGTSQTVTGFTVTPTSLAEGSNTVIVIFDGKSATKTITGTVAEQPEDEYMEVPVGGDNGDVLTANIYADDGQTKLNPERTVFNRHWKTEPFEESKPVKVKIEMTNDVKTFDYFVAMSVHIDGGTKYGYNAKVIGSNTWTTSISHEDTVLVGAGDYLYVQKFNATNQGAIVIKAVI